MKRLITNRCGIPSALGRISAELYECIENGPLNVSISSAKRSAIQSAKIHAMYGDIAKMTVFVYYGIKVDLRIHGPEHSLEYCKAILVKWFDEEMRASGEPLKNEGKMMYCPRQNESFYCRPSTTEMSVKEMTNHILWLYAFGAEIGVKWSEKVKWYDEYPELSRG